MCSSCCWCRPNCCRYPCSQCNNVNDLVNYNCYHPETSSMFTFDKLQKPLIKSSVMPLSTPTASRNQKFSNAKIKKKFSENENKKGISTDQEKLTANSNTDKINLQAEYLKMTQNNKKDSYLERKSKVVNNQSKGKNNLSMQMNNNIRNTNSVPNYGTQSSKNFNPLCTRRCGKAECYCGIRNDNYNAYPNDEMKFNMSTESLASVTESDSGLANPKLMRNSIRPADLNHKNHRNSKNAHFRNIKDNQMEVINEETEYEDDNYDVNHGKRALSNSSKFHGKPSRNLESSCADLLSLMHDNILESVQVSVEKTLNKYQKDTIEKLNLLTEKFDHSEAVLEKLYHEIMEKINNQNEANLRQFRCLLQLVCENQNSKSDQSKFDIENKGYGGDGIAGKDDIYNGTHEVDETTSPSEEMQTDFKICNCEASDSGTAAINAKEQLRGSVNGSSPIEEAGNSKCDCDILNGKNNYNTSNNSKSTNNMRNGADAYNKLSYTANDDKRNSSYNAKNSKSLISNAGNNMEIACTNQTCKHLKKYRDNNYGDSFPPPTFVKFTIGAKDGNGGHHHHHHMHHNKFANLQTMVNQAEISKKICVCVGVGTDNMQRKSSAGRYLGNDEPDTSGYATDRSESDKTSYFALKKSTKKIKDDNTHSKDAMKQRVSEAICCCCNEGCTCNR